MNLCAKKTLGCCKTIRWFMENKQKIIDTRNIL